MKALVDTSILIDYLKGIDAARDELARYDEVLISAITWIEVMVGARQDEELAIRRFLDRFRHVALDQRVAERAVLIRRQTRIRLPDAIVWASAKCEGALLVSRNARDFPPAAPDVRMPYAL